MLPRARLQVCRAWTAWRFDGEPALPWFNPARGQAAGRWWCDATGDHLDHEAILVRGSLASGFFPHFNTLAPSGTDHFPYPEGCTGAQTA
jgi:hypothetical protein